MKRTKLKRNIVVAVLFFLPIMAFGQSDQPNAPSPIQSIAAGSFVVPMDTEHQAIVPAGQAPFNLKAYGLINELLQNGIPVKWVIKPNKLRDEIDFSTTVERIAPSAQASALLNFRSGPFVVPDTILPCGLSTREVISAFGNNVAVYRLGSSVQVPVRYTLTHRPKIAVFNNGGNEMIHTKILDAAGIDNYDVMDAANISNLINCYTFASEPHADDNQISDAVVAAVKAFVMNGGNFLAQCHAITPYENKALFVTTGGLFEINATVTNQYHNSDLAISQFHGTFQENEGGSVQNYHLPAGSTWRPSAYKIVADAQSDAVVAMGAHLIAPSAPGGNVYYLGGHDYSRGRDRTQPDLTLLPRVNSLRMYLNAALIPSNNSSGAWAKAGSDKSISCDSAVLGCTPTGPPGSSFSWSPATGLSCTTCANPVARPSVTTTYIITIANGCVARDTVTVEVGGVVSADFTFDTVCVGEATRFQASTSSSSYQWNFGDPSSSANSSTLPSPSHLFSRAGSFQVQLVTGLSASCSDTMVHTVTVKGKPIISLSSDTVCQGQEAVLVVRGAEQYLWENGSRNDTLLVRLSATTRYRVTASNSATCALDTFLTASVVPGITSSFVKKEVDCFGGNNGSITLTVSGGSPAYRYDWGTGSSATASLADNLRAGTYQVVISDRAGCQDSLSITLLQPPALNAQVITTPASCFGAKDGTATVQASGGTSPYEYHWPTLSLANTSVLSQLAKGAYPVQIRDTKGCRLDTQAVIIEPAQRIAAQAIALQPTCVDKAQGRAKASVRGSTGPYSFTWNTVPPQRDSTATGLRKGTYEVSVSDRSGCSAKATVTIKEHPPISLDLGPNRVTCFEKDPAVVLQTSATGKYLWEPGGETTASISVKTTGRFTLIITDTNGCTAAASTSVIEICPPRLFVPNSFTPNGDGVNDAYTVFGEHIGEFEMYIFNRWGEIIFESKDKSHVWDGNYRAEPMPIGVYPWIITYTGSHSEYHGPYRMKGSVTVIR